MNINKKVAERILELKQRENLTMEKLAWRGNLSKSGIGYVLKGANNMKPLT